MRNVIVFALDGARHAVELRWVREVVATGWVTPVPDARRGIVGVFNFHGEIVPLVDVAVARGARRRAEPSGSAIVIEVDGVRSALRIGAVEEVSTLDEVDGQVIDARGRAIALIDPPALIAGVRGRGDERGDGDEREAGADDARERR